jgi:hypothetical protein
METNFKREERLLKVLGIVTDWLKFAETKNAMLIGFNGASIYGLAKAMDLDFFVNNPIWKNYAFYVIVLFVISTILSLLAFVPQLRLISSKSLLAGEEPNCIFFEHLKEKSEIDIMQLICETKDMNFSRFEKDTANQIQQNAKIASRKYAHFNIAVWLTMCAYITPLLTATFLVYNWLHTKRPQ